MNERDRGARLIGGVRQMRLNGPGVCGLREKETPHQDLGFLKDVSELLRDAETSGPHHSRRGSVCGC